MLVTSLDLSSNLESRHAACQLRHGLETYAASNSFNPKVAIKPEVISGLISLHQKRPRRQSREDIKNRFDRPVKN